VIGLCHGLFENLAFLQRFYGLESEDEISCRYAGLNHFFWMTDIRARGQDLLADLRQRLETQTFTDLLREAHRDPMGFKSNRELATELFRLTQVMPYLGDRHTCEFFGCYITSRQNMDKYMLVRTSVQERIEGLERRRETLQQWANEGIRDDFVTKSRETAADIIAAHVQGHPFIDVGNLPNHGQISNLARGTVVETAVRVDQNGFSPIAFGQLPTIVRGLVEPYATAFDLGVEACFAGDRRLALQALRLDPVCSHLTGDEVNSLGNRLLQAHRDYTPMFG
jgi:alpha-galactosidase/6-phospho-beta-glucosidase family protein